MRIKMTEHYQGTGVSAVLVRTGSTVNTLEPGEVYEVAGALGDELLKHRKAEKADAASVHYGAQKEPELRHDDELHKAMVSKPGGSVTLVTEEPPAEEPIMTSKKPKRGKG
jgi:hypothetical protein